MEGELEHPCWWPMSPLIDDVGDCSGVTVAPGVLQWECIFTELHRSGLLVDGDICDEGGVLSWHTSDGLHPVIILSDKITGVLQESIPLSPLCSDLPVCVAESDMRRSRGLPVSCPWLSLDAVKLELLDLSAKSSWRLCLDDDDNKNVPFSCILSIGSKETFMHSITISWGSFCLHLR